MAIIANNPFARPAQQQRPADRIQIDITPGLSPDSMQVEVPHELLDTPLLHVIRQAVRRPGADSGAVAAHLASLIARGDREIRLEHEGSYHDPQASAREVLFLEGSSDQGQAQQRRVRVMKRQRGGRHLWG